jgi:putative spermidine/putrescine transport system substrate-binding protein
MKKKNLGYLLLAVFLVATAAGCKARSGSGADARSAAPGAKIGQGRTLVVGVWGGPQEDLVREFVIKPFEAETGATVQLTLGGSTDRYAKTYAELDNPTLDIVYLDLTQTERVTKDAVVLPPDGSKVPEYNNVYENLKAFGGYPVALNAVGLMYNTDKIPEAPKSWLDCWKPEYKGKVAPMVFPGSQGTGFLLMAAKVHGGNEYNITPGFEALKNLKPFPMILSGIDETNLAFEQGDVWLTPQISGYVYAFKKNEAGPVDFAIPAEGGILSMNFAHITKNSKNADLAAIFINYHLAQACQEAYAARLFYGPTNRTVKLSDDLADAVIYGEEKVSLLLSFDNAYLAENESKWADIWNREILD